ncbi:MAG TPA: hypothetical protein PKM63_11000 [Panacibacter sp.]|nr:hypothetical protein [Panacibacter sp.]HNP44807.1 hypothetical protein [Panacibacter sp.]
MKKICLFVNLLLIVGISVSAQASKDSLQKTFIQPKDTLKTFNLRVLSSNYYSNNLGFFCKKELQLEKAVKFPLKFRLGSVAYCDAIEGKSGQHP